MRARSAHRRRKKMSEVTTALHYLASPYSHKDAWLRELRFRAISRVAGALRKERGIVTFCPISHSHPISEELQGVDPTDHDFWLGWDNHFNTACAGLIVAMLPGWGNSRGIASEIELFRAASKPVEKLQSRKWFTGTEWQMLEAGIE